MTTEPSIRRVVLLYKIERWISLMPLREAVGIAFILAGVSSFLVSGVLVLDSPLISMADLVLGVFLSLVGLVLYQMD